VQRPVASHDLLAQRRRKLRGTLEPAGEAVTAARADSSAPTRASLETLLAAAPRAGSHLDVTTELVASSVESSGVPPATPMRDRPALRIADLELGHGREAATALPGSATGAHAVLPIVPASSSVRRLLTPSSPLDALPDAPVNTLLDAAHRHGVDLT
jgi:hypothetical protein